MSITTTVSDLPEVKRPVFKGLPEGWSVRCSDDGKSLSAFTFYPRYEINLEKEPRIKFVELVRHEFEAKGKDLKELMSKAEKICKTIDDKNRLTPEQEELFRQLHELRRGEGAERSAKFKSKASVFDPPKKQEIEYKNHWLIKLNQLVKSFIMRYTRSK